MEFMEILIFTSAFNSTKKQHGTAHLFDLDEMISPNHDCDALTRVYADPNAAIYSQTASMSGGKSSYWSTMASEVTKRQTFGPGMKVQRPCCTCVKP